MKVVVISDTHGNLLALDTALKAIASEGYDLLIHLGDAVGIGPHPAECLERLLETPRLHCVQGNHDAWLLGDPPALPPEWVYQEGRFSKRLWAHILLSSEWTRGLIGSRLRSYVATWPFEITEEFEGVTATFLHYARKRTGDDFKTLDLDPTPTSLDEIFAGVTSDLLFYGHYHERSDLTGRIRYINPGSLGCHTENTARYCVAEFQHGNYTLTPRQVGYDDRELFYSFEHRRVADRDFIYEVFFGGRFV